MDETSWTPAQAQWIAPDGVVWNRQRRWLSEREARRFVMRRSGAVAVEHSATHDMTWLEPEARAAFWEANVAGHIEDREQAVAANQHGVTYHVSTWKNNAGGRLVLLSEMC